MSTGGDILNLKHLKAVNTLDKGDHYLIEAASDERLSSCPGCGGPSLHGHGTQRQQYIDVPMHGRSVLLEVDRKRFRCNGCGRTVFAPLSEADGKRQATLRLVAYVRKHCTRRTFADVAREVGVDDKTIRHIFDDYVEELARTIRFETPEVLGIDELKIVGDYRAIITNVEKLSLYDILETRKKSHLLPFFNKLPDKHRVRIVTMDLWSVYRQVAKAELPGRLIVADRWHVLRMSNDSMEKVRKVIRKSLDTRTRLRLKDDRFVLLAREKNLNDGQKELLKDWSQRFPLLHEAYKVKELFHGLYEYESRSQAEKAAQAWLNSIPQDLVPHFRETAGALVSWWDEIFNYYDHPITNAYTESVNRLAKDMNRMGRGYSFEVIRARMKYDDESRKVTRETVRTATRKARAAGSGQANPNTIDFVCYRPEDRVHAQADLRVVEYGPHIPTLCDRLEKGAFE